uniref:Uncharacterized protein n=1 Tax=Rhizophora mucronata TaxID=61149 RepID=A0A2P2P240_RHIMU
MEDTIDRIHSTVLAQFLIILLQQVYHQNYLIKRLLW